MIKKTILYLLAVFALLAILFYNTETNEKIKDILSKVNTIDQEMSRAGAKEKGLTELNQTYANYIKKLQNAEFQLENFLNSSTQVQGVPAQHVPA